MGRSADNQGSGDDFLGPMDDIVLAHEEWGIDFEADVVVMTGDVPNNVSLRNLIPPEPAKGLLAVQAGDHFIVVAASG